MLETEKITNSNIFQEGEFIDDGVNFGRPRGIFITSDDRISCGFGVRSRHWAGELMGIMKGIRIGSAVDGTVDSFIEDLEPLRDDHSGQRVWESITMVMSMEPYFVVACLKDMF
ncbi:MAG: hypothetical protein Ct9H90mP25_0960 [Gammaproteobacteria bacterium]|nr:MAG: hypothetical protein Ct9H90mP25_0960 [Gammaproteobacteria bacterium]